MICQAEPEARPRASTKQPKREGEAAGAAHDHTNDLASAVRCFTTHKLRVLPWHTLASLGPVARHNARHGMRLHNSYGYVMHAVVMHVLQHVCVRVCVGVQRLTWHECGHLHLSPRCARVTAIQKRDHSVHVSVPIIVRSSVQNPSSYGRMRPLIAMRISLTPRLQRGRRGRQCGGKLPPQWGHGTRGACGLHRQLTLGGWGRVQPCSKCSLA